MNTTTPDPRPAEAAIAALENAASSLVDASLNQFYGLHPGLREQHGPKGVARCRVDCHHHIEFIIAAIRNQSPRSFAEYIRWLRVVLEARGRNAATGLGRMLEIMGQQVRGSLGEGVWAHVQPPLDAALLALRDDSEADHALYTMPPPGVLMRRYLDQLLQGDRLAAQQVVMGAFHEGLTIRQIYLDVFQPALYEIGRLWERGQISVAQEHLATAITQTILARIYAETPLDITRDEIALVACLPGNHHQVGPRMVADFLALAGFDSRFLGADTPTDDLLTMIDEVKPAVIGLPSTLSSHVHAIQATIERIRADFTSYRPTIMVGGLAFNLVDGLWQRVGGDVWGRDAAEAVDHLVGASN
jgi:MerR family transcriptional regulator, light-induced transcriptional regulator